MLASLISSNTLASGLFIYIFQRPFHPLSRILNTWQSTILGQILGWEISYFLRTATSSSEWSLEYSSLRTTTCIQKHSPGLVPVATRYVVWGLCFGSIVVKFIFFHLNSLISSETQGNPNSLKCLSHKK